MLLSYLTTTSWWEILGILGELTGFVIIAFHVADLTHWIFQIPLTLFFGAAWFMLFDTAWYMMLIHYGILRGI